MDISPLDDLLKRLEESLVKLLESVRGDPWSLLIFQTLIWSFRRWAVHYLISDDVSDNMHDYLWDSHIDLVKNYAPEGLQEFGVVWLNPANVGDRTDSLEELNSYFLFIVDKLNRAVDTGNDDEQNLLAIFLDETITDILGEWLEGRTEYRIYPGHDESSENFPSEKIFAIMQKIMEKNARPRNDIQLPAPPAPPSILETLHSVQQPHTDEKLSSTVDEQTQDATVHKESQDATVDKESRPVALLPPTPEILIVPVPVEPTPIHKTIAAALKRRLTLRLHGRRSESNRSNVATTRKRRVMNK